MTTFEQDVETVAKAIAQADEQNGAAPYEYRIQNKYAKEFLFDKAQAAIISLQKSGWVKIEIDPQPIKPVTMGCTIKEFTIP